MSVASPEVAPADTSCSVHPDRPAVDRCRSCGRPACLACAVPFRGAVLCAECAARELGEPAPAAPPGPRRERHPAAAVALSVAVLATIPPWDRFGALAAAFSAWGGTRASLVAALCLAAAAVVAMLGRLLPLRLAAGGYALLAAVGAGATARTVLTAPEYVRHTLAPYVALVAAGVGVAIGVARLAASRASRSS